jgi:hypothetical protein
VIKLVQTAAALAIVASAPLGCDKAPAPQSAAPAPAPAAPASAALGAPLVLPADARSGTSADGTNTVKWDVVGGSIPDA